MGTAFLQINDITRPGRKSKWGIDYYSPWEFDPKGKKKRVKRFFATKELRESEKDILRERFAKFGASAGQQPSEDELADYRVMRALLPRHVTASKAAKFFVAHQRDSGMPLVVPKDSKARGFFDRYIDSMVARGLDRQWIKQTKSRLERFAAFMPEGTGVGDVTREDGRRWMAALAGTDQKSGYSDTTRNNMRRCVYGAFQWAVEEEIIDSNPFDRVEVPKVVRRRPNFYTVPESRALLAATALWYPDYVRFVVLRLFVGMRRSQIRRLVNATDINVEKRKVDAPGFREVAGKKEPQRVTKSGHRHLIQDAPACLWDWLKRFPDLNTANHLQKFRKIHRRAGVQPKRNGFRHTFSTYFVALHGDANLTMHILGQEEDSKAFFDHYRGHADKEEAELFFALFFSAVLPFCPAPAAAPAAS